MGVKEWLSGELRVATILGEIFTYSHKDVSYIHDIFESIAH